MIVSNQLQRYCKSRAEEVYITDGEMVVIYIKIKVIHMPSYQVNIINTTGAEMRFTLGTLRLKHTV